MPGPSPRRDTTESPCIDDDRDPTSVFFYRPFEERPTTPDRPRLAHPRLLPRSAIRPAPPVWDEPDTDSWSSPGW